MNDSSELRLGLEYIRNEISAQKENINRVRSDEDLDNMLAVISSIESVNVAVISFTENGDQLSQWRGYTKVGDGYSLGFDGVKINDQALNNQHFLVPCVYDRDDHKLIVKELVEFGKVAGKPQKEKSEISILHGMEFSRAALLIATVIKNEKFEEEKEWRLVTSLMDYRKAELKQGSFSLIPYWKYEIPIDKILRKIIIGPTPESKLSLSAVQGLLTKYYPENHQGINIVNSEIPYRNL